jgi:putative transcriptional regulator
MKRKRNIMSDEDFAALRGAIAEGGAILRSELPAARRTVIEAPDVAAIRASLKLSRSKFARALGVSARTIEGWEQRRRQTTGAARVLLTIATQHPQIIAEAPSKEVAVRA